MIRAAPAAVDVVTWSCPGEHRRELDDDFGDERFILADDLDSFVRAVDRHRSLTVVHEAGERDFIGEARQWWDGVRADSAAVEPCAAMQRTVDKWADGSRDGWKRGTIAIVRMDEKGHHGLAAALDQLWSVRAKDERDFRRLVEYARFRVLTKPTPPGGMGCRCEPAKPAADDSGPAEDGPEDEPRRALHLQTFADLAAEVDAAGDPQWLVRGVIAAGDYGVLGGESKTQKTWNAIDLAVAVAAGTRWLGALPVDRTGPVIVFVGEGGKRNIVRRIRATAAAHGCPRRGPPDPRLRAGAEAGRHRSHG